jgi:probable rRNA maturation factor
MILNQQPGARVDLAAARALVARMRCILDLRDREFNVCFVDDDRMAELNREFRGKHHPTDVLSFQWQEGEMSDPWGQRAQSAGAADLEGFLGDVVISVETARRNASAEGHSLGREINWLILHGLLHLLGMDHEKDNGEMTALEYDWRARLGLDKGAGKLSNSKAVRKGRTLAPSSRIPPTPRRKRTVH